MHATAERAGLAPVADDEVTDPRARALRERRIAAGIKSRRALVEATKQLGMPVSKDAVDAAENGTASDATYDRLDAFLSRWEERTGHDEDEPNLVTFRLSRKPGTEVTVQGPVANVSELEAAFERLLDRLDKDDQN